MVKRLSCVATDVKCNDCPISSGCQYYRITGENFSGYPGIFFEKTGFEKRLFKENEEFRFTVFCIGKSSLYRSYINIFFENYSDGKLAGFPFLLKSIEKRTVSSSGFIPTGRISIISPVESSDFSQVYNNMVSYYRDFYGLDLVPVEESFSAENVKEVNSGKVYLGTKAVNIRGYVYNLTLQDSLPDIVSMFGVGKYNFLGGGRFETESEP